MSQGSDDRHAAYLMRQNAATAIMRGDLGAATALLGCFTQAELDELVDRVSTAHNFLVSYAQAKRRSSMAKVES